MKRVAELALIILSRSTGFVLENYSYIVSIRLFMTEVRTEYSFSHVSRRIWHLINDSIDMNEMNNILMDQKIETFIYPKRYTKSIDCRSSSLHWMFQ